MQNILITDEAVAKGIRWVCARIADIKRIAEVHDPTLSSILVAGSGGLGCKLSYEEVGESMILSFGPTFTLTEIPRRNVVASYIIRDTDEDPKSPDPYVSLHWKTPDELFSNPKSPEAWLPLVALSKMFASSKSLTHPLFSPCTTCFMFELREEEVIGTPLKVITERILKYLPSSKDISLVLDNYCIKTILPLLITELPRDRISIIHNHTHESISDHSKKLISSLGLKRAK